MARICRVLVVEDNGDVRQLLGEAFAHEGYRFALAEDGAAMRRVLAAGDVDVVVASSVVSGGCARTRCSGLPPGRRLTRSTCGSRRRASSAFRRR